MEPERQKVNIEVFRVQILSDWSGHIEPSWRRLSFARPTCGESSGMRDLAGIVIEGGARDPPKIGDSGFRGEKWHVSPKMS